MAAVALRVLLDDVFEKEVRDQFEFTKKVED
jgi:hypothetical protein